MHTLAGNELAIIGIFLCLVPITAWYLILRKQHENCTTKTYRVNVLLARTSLFLPAYAVCVCVSCMQPQMYEGFQIAFALIEAYSFYSFFAMLVSNMGGPNAALRTMQGHAQVPFCVSCCPTEPSAFYNKVHTSLWYMMFVRVPIIIVATIGSYKHLQALYGIATFLSLFVIGYAIACLISFYENNFHLNMGHLYKMLTVKLSVGIIVIESLIETLLYMSGAFNNISPRSGYTIEGTVVRTFCFIVLLEYIILSVAMWVIWSKPVTYVDFPSDNADNSENASARPSASAGLSVSASAGGNNSSFDDNNRPSFGAFVSDVFSFTDLWYKHDLHLDSSSLNVPLMGSGGSNL